MIQLRVAIESAVEAFEQMAQALADAFKGFQASDLMAAQPEYTPNSSLYFIGGHYFGLYWYSDVSEALVLPKNPAMRRWPIFVFRNILEIIGVCVEPRPPP